MVVTEPATTRWAPDTGGGTSSSAMRRPMSQQLPEPRGMSHLFRTVRSPRQQATCLGAQHADNRNINLALGAENCFCLDAYFPGCGGLQMAVELFTGGLGIGLDGNQAVVTV